MDRLWFRANVAVWLLGAVSMLPYAMLGIYFAAMGSAILTLVFVTIPSRVALNVVIRERRRRYFKETVVCCVTFCVLCWVAYLFSYYPNPYE